MTMSELIKFCTTKYKHTLPLKLNTTNATPRKLEKNKFRKLHSEVVRGPQGEVHEVY